MQELLQQVTGLPPRHVASPLDRACRSPGSSRSIGVGVVYQIPEKYEASARVYVDTESLLRPLLAGLAIQPNLDQQVALMSRTLISRPNVEKLVRMADLDLGRRVERRARRARRLVIEDASGSKATCRTNLYVISYRDPNPNQREEGRAVAAVDLRRVEPRRQAPGHADRRQVPRRPDQALRREPAGGGEPDQGFQAQVHGRDAARDRTISRACRSTRRGHRSRPARAAGAPSRRATRTSASSPARMPEPAGRRHRRAPPTRRVPEVDARIDALTQRPRRPAAQVHRRSIPTSLSTRRLIEQLEEQRKTELARAAQGRAGLGRQRATRAGRRTRSCSR